MSRANCLLPVCSFSFVFFFHNFIYLFWAVLDLLCRLSPAVGVGAILCCSAWPSHLQWVLLLQSTGSRRMGSTGAVPGSRAQAQQLWPRALAAPQQVGSSQTRDRTHVSCIGRQMLHHGATRKPLLVIFIVKFQSWKGLSEPMAI